MLNSQQLQIKIIHGNNNIKLTSLNRRKLAMDMLFICLLKVSLLRIHSVILPSHHAVCWLCALETEESRVTSETMGE